MSYQNAMVTLLSWYLQLTESVIYSVYGLVTNTHNATISRMTNLNAGLSWVADALSILTKAVNNTMKNQCFIVNNKLMIYQYCLQNEKGMLKVFMLLQRCHVKLNSSAFLQSKYIFTFPLLTFFSDRICPQVTLIIIAHHHRKTDWSSLKGIAT